MRKIILPAADFMPDRPELFHPGALRAQEVLPRTGGLGPMNQFSIQSDSLSGAPRGGGVFLINGTEYVFAGTATAIERLNLSTDTWDDVTRTSGGAYAMSGSKDNWSFVNYGTNVLGFCEGSVAQSYVAGSSTDFANLAGSPPQARHACVLQQFVIVGHLSTDSQAIHWSEQDDPTGWTVGDNLCDTQTLPDGGDVTGLVTVGDYALVFQERQISRLQFTGGPLIASIVKVANHGTYAPQSIVVDQDIVYYLASDGFYGFNGGATFPIGSEVINRFFFENCDKDDLYKVSGEIDPINRLIVWSFPEKAGGVSVRTLIYNPVIGKWSYSAQAAGTLLLPIPAESADMPDDLDQGDLYVRVFDASNRLGTFTSANTAQAVVETAMFGLPQNSRVLTARPLVNGTTDVDDFDVRILSRFRIGEADTTTTITTLGADGKGRLRSNGRYHRARVTIDAATAWTEFTGVEIEYEMTGNR